MQKNHLFIRFRMSLNNFKRTVAKLMSRLCISVKDLFDNIYLFLASFMLACKNKFYKKEEKGNASSSQDDVQPWGWSSPINAELSTNTYADTRTLSIATPSPRGENTISIGERSISEGFTEASHGSNGSKGSHILIFNHPNRITTSKAVHISRENSKNSLMRISRENSKSSSKGSEDSLDGEIDYTVAISSLMEEVPVGLRVPPPKLSTPKL